MRDTMTAGQRLTVKLQFAVPPMLREMARLWEGDLVRETYLEWLRILHGMIRATVPLMLTATDACVSRVGDPVADQFGAYLARHIREEFGHDEWVAEDYAAAGGDPAELADMAVGGAVAALVGSQYYWIRHVHPIGLLGHIAVLELKRVRPLCRTPVGDKHDDHESGDQTFHDRLKPIFWRIASGRFFSVSSC